MIQRNGRRHWATGILAVCILLGGDTLAVSRVQVGVGIAVPGLSIGINIPAYPQLVPIPGYPVYYAPGLSANLFFYDGLYWVLVGDNWYYSSWYDGPWSLAEPELVPDFILRVPILYYRSPPPYFLHWNRVAPPRWGEHWGPRWEDRRRGWDRWDRAHAPPRAPLPGYQSQYPRGRYPGADDRRKLQDRYYHYRPRDPADRSRLQQSPQFGRRVAPPSNRPPQNRRPSEAPPQAHRVPPGTVQRPPGFARPSPPARTERRSPDASRPDSRAGAHSTRPRSESGPPDRQGRPDRQEQRRESRPHGDAGRARRPSGGPPT